MIYAVGLVELYYNDVLNDSSNIVEGSKAASYSVKEETYYYTVTTRESFKKNGFAHRQGSGYISKYT